MIEYNNALIPLLPPTVCHWCFSCGGEAEAVKVQWHKLGQLYSSWAQVLFPPVFLFCADGGESWGFHICTVFNLRVCASALRHVGSAIPHTIPAKIVEVSCWAAMALLVLCLNRSIPWWWFFQKLLWRTGFLCPVGNCSVFYIWYRWVQHQDKA